jgi:protein PET117
MSRTAKATLAAAVTFCSVTIFTVHYMQRQEREVCVTFQARSSYSLLILTTQTMYQGVLRDDARRLEKHKQREEALQESLRKRELYEKVQTVSYFGSLPRLAVFEIDLPESVVFDNSDTVHLATICTAIEVLKLCPQARWPSHLTPPGITLVHCLGNPIYSHSLMTHV